MSDILIKGMKMPKSCCECPLVRLSQTGESLVCNYMLSTVPWDETPFDCPLVPVPPHGRLIDADKYLGTIRPLCPEDSQAACTFETVKMLMMNSINKAPTIIPASEVDT